MTPLPAAVDPAAPFVAWRIDAERHGAAWDSGIGAELLGGRWNPKGFKAVYCSIDPSTCLVETAVHRGFEALDTSPHLITGIEILDPASTRLVMPGDIPNPAWLHGGTPSANQQAFGATLLAAHSFVLFPSAVSKLSWNLVFEPNAARGKYRLRSQERLVVDTRFNPPAT
jgi:RES domain-containing protein